MFQEHFLEVIQNQEFLLLPTAEIVKLLSSDDINVPDEETIFQALMLWVRYDVQNRQQDLGVLLAYIRLPLLPPQVRGQTTAFLLCCRINIRNQSYLYSKDLIKIIIKNLISLGL